MLRMRSEAVRNGERVVSKAMTRLVIRCQGGGIPREDGQSSTARFYLFEPKEHPK